MTRFFENLVNLIDQSIAENKLDFAKILLDFYCETKEGCNDVTNRRLPLAEAYFRNGYKSDACLQYLFAARKEAQHGRDENAIALSEKVLELDANENFAVVILIELCKKHDLTDRYEMYLRKFNEIELKTLQDEEARLKEFPSMFTRLADGMLEQGISYLRQAGSEGDYKAKNMLIDLQEKIIKALRHIDLADKIRKKKEAEKA